MGEVKTLLTGIAGQTLPVKLYQHCLWQHKAALNTLTLEGEAAFAAMALTPCLFIPYFLKAEIRTGQWGRVRTAR